MLTAVELQIVERCAYAATLTLSFPMDWEKSKRLLVPTKSKLKYSLILINFSVTILYIVFQILRLVPGLGYNYKNRESKDFVASLVFHFYFICSQWILALIQWHSLSQTNGWCTWFNQIRRFNKSFGAHF